MLVTLIGQRLDAGMNRCQIIDDLLGADAAFKRLYQIERVSWVDVADALRLVYGVEVVYPAKAIRRHLTLQSANLVDAVLADCDATKEDVLLCLKYEFYNDRTSHLVQLAPPSTQSSGATQ